LAQLVGGWGRDTEVPWQQVALQYLEFLVQAAAVAVAAVAVIWIHMGHA